MFYYDTNLKESGLEFETVHKAIDRNNPGYQRLVLPYSPLFPVYNFFHAASYLSFLIHAGCTGLSAIFFAASTNDLTYFKAYRRLKLPTSSLSWWYRFMMLESN